MDPRRLRHFVALAEERSFTRAAARESIVQSGLSASIKALEADVGASLHVKGTRPVRLTAEGEALTVAARHALEALDSTYQVVDAVRGRLSGRFRLGVFRGTDHLIPVSGTLAALLQDHPALELALRQGASSDMIASVAAGDLDCAIVSAGQVQVNGVRIHPLAQEPFVLLAPSNHPLADRRELTLTDLADVAFIEMAVGFTSRTLSDLTFATAGVSRRVVCEAGDWMLAAELIAAGVGIGLLPQGIADEVQARRPVSVRQLSVDGLRLKRRIDLAIPGGDAAPPAAIEFARRLALAASPPR